MNFSLGKETKTKGRVSIEAPKKVGNSYVFPIAELTSVRTEVREKKDGSESYHCLIFSHQQIIPTKEEAIVKEFDDVIFPLDVEAKDAEDAFERLKQKIAHYYSTFTPIPDEGIVKEASSITEFYDKVAEAFNTHRNGGPIFKKESGSPIKYHLKLTYYKNKLQTGITSFMDRVREGMPTELSVDLSRESISQVENNGVGGNIVQPAVGSITYPGDGNAPIF